VEPFNKRNFYGLLRHLTFELEGGGGGGGGVKRLDLHEANYVSVHGAEERKMNAQ
jgi:hypothetical protein